MARYVIHDRVAPSPDGRRNTIPHFLLNDVVRYWRTMASDYASKMWERGGDGWAVRNIKLRFSGEGEESMLLAFDERRLALPANEGFWPVMVGR